MASVAVKQVWLDNDARSRKLGRAVRVDEVNVHVQIATCSSGYMVGRQFVIARRGPLHGINATRNIGDVVRVRIRLDRLCSKRFTFLGTYGYGSIVEPAV